MIKYFLTLLTLKAKTFVNNTLRKRYKNQNASLPPIIIFYTYNVLMIMAL